MLLFLCVTLTNKLLWAAINFCLREEKPKVEFKQTDWSHPCLKWCFWDFLKFLLCIIYVCVMCALYLHMCMCEWIYTHTITHMKAFSFHYFCDLFSLMFGTVYAIITGWLPSGISCTCLPSHHRITGIIDTCSTLCVYWEFELGSSYMCGVHFIYWTVSAALFLDFNCRGHSTITAVLSL